MKRPLAASLLLTALLSTAASASPVSDISQEWAGYWNARNVKAIMTLYADDATFMPTTGRPWRGDAAIRKGFAGVLKVYEPDIHLTSVKADSSGTLAYDSGTYDETLALVKGGKAVHARGAYLFVFQRQTKRGGWKIVQQSWSQLEPTKL
jgi:uncharacterized protein (TIGR02246 family)